MGTYKDKPTGRNEGPEGGAVPEGAKLMQSENFWIYDDVFRQREARLREAGFDCYCLFSMTYREIKIAQEVNSLNEECLAMPFLRVKRGCRDGKAVLAQDVLLQGYVFIFVPKGKDMGTLHRGETPWRILERKEGGGLLLGQDREYAEWVLDSGGILDVSQAIEINDQIQIISGPLLRLRGCVIGISRRKKNYHVQFEMMGQSVAVWLPYELVEPAGKWKRTRRTDAKQNGLLRLEQGKERR
ncbi:MAG: hypothetical protein Q4B48_08750 [Syntrophomonadaceae bacterium]|nr:hypothetical protein [Syntrophomonadaceae bacterium]